jgi:dienelactone hydrolase
MKTIAGVLAFAALLTGAQPDVLPGTSRWNFPADIVAEQYAELDRYLDREIRSALEQRQPFTDPVAARRDLRRLIGAIDAFLPLKPKREEIGRLGAIQVSLVEWPVLPIGSTPPTRGSAGSLVRQFGILLEPETAQSRPGVIALADADSSAADIAGLSSRLPAEKQLARRLAERGYVVYAPFFTQRRAFSEPWTDDRSWLVRLAYQTGHHLIGSEAQQVAAAREYLATLPGVDKNRIALAGSGQGGMLALYTAAIEPGFAAAWTGGYSGVGDRLPEEPEDRIVWGIVRFGGVRLASLAAPCRLLLDAGPPGAGLDSALRHTPLQVNAGGTLALDPDRVAQIANAQFSGWQARYRNAALEAYATREAAWQPDTSSIENFRTWAKPKMEEYWDRIGRYPAGQGSLDTRSIKIYDNDELTAYRLSVRLYDGVHAYGILAIPKKMRAGEKRPLVFVQHGQGGTPEDALGIEPNPRADAVYSRFGLALLRRGYLVFAPMISTQTKTGRDEVSRRTQILGRSVIGIEVRKFGRVLDFLSTQTFVDSSRFAFYGLSYGGYTALWTGPVEPRFKVVISSGHFNDWDVKTSDITQGTSFLFYESVLDMFSFNLLPRFSHSEVAMLIAPRPFMIEAGAKDGVIIAPRRFADLEMSRVEELYRRLGIPEKGRVARFDGPHQVNGAEAYPFLDHWLNWTPVAE